MPESAPDNTTVVRRSFDALNAGDLDAVFECFQDDCVFDGSRVAEGVYEGQEHYRAFLQGALDSLSPQHEFTLEAEGDHVLASCRIVGRGHASGAPIEMPVAYVYRLREGLIAHQTIYADIEEARAAFRRASTEST